MKSITNSNQIAERNTRAAKSVSIEPVTRRSTANGRGWNSITDAELVRAVELMVSPSDLAIRGAALAVLKAFGYSPEEVREQLKGGEYFNNGPAFDGLATDTPRIIIA